MSLLFGVKTVVDSNRGRLETCRGHVSTRGGLPAGRRIHLIYCLLTPWTHVHVEASKMSLTQTVTQMRIGLSVRLARRWSLRFPKRGVPLNCCSSLAASFFLSSLPSVTSLPCAIPVPALRSCLTNTAFASSLVRSALLHCVASPVSIISGDGCSIFKVQCRAHIFIDFCAAVHYTELIFRHSFQRFCSCPQRRNLKNFLLFKTVERIVYNLSKLWRCLYGKVEANRRYF